MEMYLLNLLDFNSMLKSPWRNQCDCLSYMARSQPRLWKGTLTHRVLKRRQGDLYKEGVAHIFPVSLAPLWGLCMNNVGSLLRLNLGGGGILLGPR